MAAKIADCLFITLGCPDVETAECEVVVERTSDDTYTVALADRDGNIADSSVARSVTFDGMQDAVNLLMKQHLLEAFEPISTGREA